MYGFGEGHGHLRDDRHNAVGQWKIHDGPALEDDSEF
jgi:hypothetical protein